MAAAADENGKLIDGLLLFVIAAGVVMRLLWLGDHPAGLYYDEAINGLDAVGVLRGEHHLYFSANNGREPFFIYVIAATIRLFGRTELGIRAAAALLGILTLPAAYLLGAAWKNRRTGLLSAAILSVMLWHVHLSRVGFRAVALPLFLALMLGLGALGLRRRSRLAMIGAGAACGLAFYTYLPARFMPVSLGLMLLYGLIWHRAWLAEGWHLLLWAAGAALIVALPLGLLTLTQPELVFGRSGQVAIWHESVHGGEFLRTLARSITRSLAMFVYRGDRNWRHDIAECPVFDPLLAVVFTAGVALALVKWRKHPPLALSLLWVASMLLPTTLSEGAPHFLRAVGVLPVAALIPALTLDWLSGRAKRPRLVQAGSVLLLMISGGLTARDYFSHCQPAIVIEEYDYQAAYRGDPVCSYYFQEAAAQLAHEAESAEGTLFLDRRFWETFPSVRYLLGERDDLVLYDEGTTLPPVDPPLTLIAWPHDGLQEALPVLPEQAQIGVWPGPETRGDLEPDTYRLYVRYQAESLQAQPDSPELSGPLARFENGITLIDVDTVEQDGLLLVILRWESDSIWQEPVKVFVHVVDADGTILAQVDEPPGSDYYPPLSWPPGSVMIHPVTLAVARPKEAAGLSLRIGLYNAEDAARYAIIGSDAPTVVLPLDGVRE